MLKLKLQYFVHLMQRTDSFEKTLMLVKIEGWKGRDDRGWDGWMASLTQWTWVWVNSSSCSRTGKPGVLQVHAVARSQTGLSDWTDPVAGLHWWFSGKRKKKKSPAHAGDRGSIPGLGRSPGGRQGNHSSILAWEIPWMKSLTGYAHRVAKKWDTT